MTMDGRRSTSDDAPIRLGAVSYLNTRPLVFGLDREPSRFDVRFDVPAKCAELLHGKAVDVGLIPSIEYPGHAYYIVPGLSIASDGPVASVAIFSKVPTRNIRSIALDTSSRTSVALLRVLCARWFEIDPRLASMPPDLDRMLDPRLASMPPDLDRMLAECDAALVIGDNALFADLDELGVEKIDLGEEWIGMTGLPFVYAFWAGRAGVVRARDVAALQQARDRGVLAIAEIGRESFPDNPEKAARADRYLRENVKYDLGEPEIAGLQRFYDLAAEVGILTAAERPQFY
jgi:chorismate dehydratase